MMLGSGAAAIIVAAVGFIALRTESIPAAACYGAGVLLLLCYELWAVALLAGPSAGEGALVQYDLQAPLPNVIAPQ